MTAERMWKLFLAEQGISDQAPGAEDPPYDAWSFGVDPDELAQLVLCGKKQGTASAHALYELDGEEIPQEGGYNIILDGEDRAVCVTKTTKVYLAPFNEVTEFGISMDVKPVQPLNAW